MTTRRHIDLREQNTSRESDLEFLKQAPSTAIDSIVTVKDETGEVVSGVVRAVRIVTRSIGWVANGTTQGIYFTLDGYRIHVQPDWRVVIRQGEGVVRTLAI